mgnify:CR=1 FL=1
MNDMDNIDLSYQATINKLENELSKLRKDKERLDWILNNYTLSCGITREEVDEKMAELGKWAK